MKNNIAAVIVSYDNSPMLRNLLSDCAAQTYELNETVVVDNSSTPETAAMVATDFASVHLKRMPGNSGSAGGFLAGIKTVMNNNDFVWTLDDDVSMPPDSLQRLLEGMQTLARTEKVGAVRSVGRMHPFAEPTELEIAPWRGTLWRTDVMKQVGLPRADYFLYGEDLEYSLRFRSHGYRFYWIPSSKCIEVRQGKTKERILGVDVGIYQSAFRFYYAFRNEISICLEYRAYSRLFRLLVYCLKVFVYLLFFGKNDRFEKLKAVLAGLWDGMRGKLGRRNRFGS
jgi:rhamnopyranosyl-N-acetylglucosaminyl-diphospho-decaprenol beta-1,3/1,4-galactofuranosyltransferase